MQPREKITDENMAKHNRYGKEDGARDALKIYLSNFSGDLATISHKESPVADYPIGSVAPFVLDHTGHPVIFTASVAQHTKNAKENSKASILIREVEKNHQIETGWRLTCVGDLMPIPEADRERVAATYFRHYPNAELYQGTHDFNFYRLNVKMGRVILGFGRIAWVDAESLVHASPFDLETENRIIEHMNDDHAEALEKYLQLLHVELKPNAKAPTMVGINQFGATIKYRKHLHFVAFDEVVSDANGAREQLVKLARQ